MVEHRYIEEIESTGIGSITFPDHAPVSIKWKLGKKNLPFSGWKLNEDLLHDRVIDQRIKEEIEFYFKTNLVGETSEAVVWEAHKVYIRGILIKVGTERKKKEAKERLALQENIQKLEQQHKQTGEKEIMMDLYKSREAMRELIELENRKIYNQVKKERYIGGNRP